MKRFAIAVLLIAALGLGTVAEGTMTVRPLNTSSRAKYDATHMVVVEYDDLTESTANTAQTLTNFPIGASESMEVLAAYLVTPFQDDGSTNINSVTMTVGDGTDADLFLTSMELNTNAGAQVYLQFGRLVWGSTDTSATAVTNVTDETVAVVPVLTVTDETVTVAPLATNVVFETLVGTNFTGTVVTNVYLQYATVAPLVTNTTVTTVSIAPVTNTTLATASVVADFALSEGRKQYTSADTIDFTFTPTGGTYGLSDLDRGEIRIYVRVRNRAEER